MSITAGKKFLVIPSDTYDMMTKHRAKSYQPEKNELIKSKEKIQNLWNTSVPPHEKVRQCTEKLNKFRSLLKTVTEPVTVQIQQQAERVKPSYDTSTQESTANEIDWTIVQGLAKASCKKGSTLLDFLKMHPDKSMWNEKGAIFYQGNTFYGPNMRNLISDVVTNRTKPLSQTFHESAFVKALADLDVPRDLVKNMKHLQVIEVNKNEKRQTMTPAGAERRKKLSSSTS